MDVSSRTGASYRRNLCPDWHTDLLLLVCLICFVIFVSLWDCICGMSLRRRLISTDATARGIDIRGVNYVINYDAPQFIRTYIHRVGRTARAGKAGVAFSLVLRIQERRFLRMLKDAGIQDIKKQPVKGNSLKPLVQQYEEALCKLEKTVKNERAQKRA